MMECWESNVGPIDCWASMLPTSDWKRQNGCLVVSVPGFFKALLIEQTCVAQALEYNLLFPFTFILVLLLLLLFLLFFYWLFKTGYNRALAGLELDM